MALGRRRGHETPQDPQRNSLVASAARIKLDGQGWKSYKFGDDTWQTEAWRLYDIIGELRFIANCGARPCLGSASTSPKLTRMGEYNRRPRRRRSPL